MHTSTLTKLTAEARLVLERTVSPAMHAVETIVAKVAPTDIPVLLIGENGAGKEVLARNLHQLSLRANQPFVKLICPFLTPESLRAAFDLRGNATSQIGTLFFEQIGELDELCQKNLLYLLPQEDSYQEATTKGPRLLFSTSRNLEEDVKADRFRMDLFYRISAVRLSLPPLRQRIEDIPTLVELFLTKYSALLGRPRLHLDSQDFLRLQSLPWSGNVRELENVVRNIVVLGEAKAIISQLPAQTNATCNSAIKVSTLKMASRAASHRTERQLILETLARTRWNRKRAARELQISYKALLYKIKQIETEQQKLAQSKD